MPKLREKELTNEFNKIYIKNLQGRAGIIEKYNFFLKLMEGARFPREDYLPPRDYSEFVAKKIPPLKEPIKTLTEIFSDTFYGNIEPSKKTPSVLMALFEKP